MYVWRFNFSLFQETGNWYDVSIFGTYSVGTCKLPLRATNILGGKTFQEAKYRR